MKKKLEKWGHSCHFDTFILLFFPTCISVLSNITVFSFTWFIFVWCKRSMNDYMLPVYKWYFSEIWTLNLLNFINGLVLLPYFGTVHYQIWGYQTETLKLRSKQYRAWSDCTNVRASLALCWWQMLITFGSSRIKVNHSCTIFAILNAYFYYTYYTVLHCFYIFL